MENSENTDFTHKLWLDPNDGSQPSWKTRDGWLDRIFAKKEYDGGGKASFARFEHPGRRNLHK